MTAEMELGRAGAAVVFCTARINSPTNLKALC